VDEWIDADDAIPIERAIVNCTANIDFDFEDQIQSSATKKQLDEHVSKWITQCGDQTYIIFCSFYFICSKF
jgi:hypothetical protein